MRREVLSVMRPAGRRLGGRALVRASRVAVVLVVCLANLAGTGVVFALAALLLPGTGVPGESTVWLVNAGVAAVYLLLAALVGFGFAELYARPLIRWLSEDRPADDRAQRRALRLPLLVFAIGAVLWSLAAALFGVLNAVYAPRLGLRVALIVGLGGATTSAMAYLLCERVLRPVAVRALASGPPPRLAAPGVAVRFLLSWSLGTAVPVVGVVLIGIFQLADEDASARQLALTMVLLGGVALVVGLLAVGVVARAVGGPLGAVGDALRRVERGDLDIEVRVDDGSELGRLQAGVNRMAGGLRERERLRDLFGRQVGEDVAQEALERGVELGGEVRDVAVLFVDVVGSTALAAERRPQEVVELLNRFFDVVVEVVDAHGGWINKFEGDAALAIFGAPVPLEHRDTRALAAARVLGERLAREVPDLAAGIGVSAGETVAGNVGTASRFEYTVIGDPVNEAARLSEHAKELPGHVAASGRLLEGAGEEEAARWSVGEELTLRGRRAPTLVATPVGRPQDAPASAVGR